MPESTEVDLDKLREAIDEEVKREGDTMLSWIALTTAILAAVTAVVSLLAGSDVNEALVRKSEATILQAQASDQWTYYQAKGIKAAVAVGRITSYTAAGRTAPDSLGAVVKRYSHEQDSISARAKELEHERDAKDDEAAELLHRHHHYANAVALLQVSIALGAVAALTKKRPVWYASIVAGAAGAILAIIGAVGH